jgi:hypothetical protein
MKQAVVNLRRSISDSLTALTAYQGSEFGKNLVRKLWFDGSTHLGNEHHLRTRQPGISLHKYRIQLLLRCLGFTKYSFINRLIFWSFAVVGPSRQSDIF